ncbi:MAG: hypothetical protein SXQ77_00615 [Halobacteria archaeon]|nr:hypothetical protein [Halobacteria archaeon]
MSTPEQTQNSVFRVMWAKVVFGIRVREWVSGLLAGIGGAINVAYISYQGFPFLRYMEMWWMPFVLYGVGFGLLFPVLVKYLANPFSDMSIEMSSKHPKIAEVMGGLVESFGLSAVTVPLGMGFGFVMWLAVGSVGMPIWVNSMNIAALSVPTFNGAVLVAHLVYGFALGGFYGILLQDVF